LVEAVPQLPVEVVVAAFLVPGQEALEATLR
jgi:hypothetical protein